MATTAQNKRCYFLTGILSIERVCACTCVWDIDTHAHTHDRVVLETPLHLPRCSMEHWLELHLVLIWPCGLFETLCQRSSSSSRSSCCSSFNSSAQPRTGSTQQRRVKKTFAAILQGTFVLFEGKCLTCTAKVWRHIFERFMKEKEY